MVESRAARAAKREAAAKASEGDSKAKPEEEADAVTTATATKKEEEATTEEESKKEESKDEAVAAAGEETKDEGDEAPAAETKDAEKGDKVEEDTKKEDETKEDEDTKAADTKEAKKPAESKEEEEKTTESKKTEEPKKPDEAKEEVPLKEEPKEEAAPPPASAPVPSPAPPPPNKIAKPIPMEVELPSTPIDRDVCVGDDKHKGTMVLIDLIRLHYLLLKKDKDKVEADDKAIDDLATSLSQLMLKGKKYELSGLKDVPKSYLKGKGRIFGKKDDEWVILSDEDAKESVKTIIQAEFKAHDDAEGFPNSDLKTLVAQLFKNVDPASKAKDDPPAHSAPRPCDVLFLPVDYPWEENMPYEHQSGNKHLLFLASQHVAADTNDSKKRVEAAFRLVTSQVEVNSGTELVPKIPRYVIQQLVQNQNSWREMGYIDLAEFAAIFVFEVYLEKQIHGIGGSVSSHVAVSASDHTKPGTEPIDEPTEYDVLFGRGGMTNGHPGNRRFRDIIALHRPDYIRATKMDKPNVARRIVRAIRAGSPPGNFLKKGDDGKWYDVGDRCAAEKTSQGLRERSNAEKRQRSALREALRIRREDLEGPAATTTGAPASKKAKISDPSGMGQLGLSSVVPTYVGAQMNYAGGIPLSLSMKEKPKEPKAKKPKKGKEEAPEDSNKETLPPNAVDNDGNILVTDYDILCGRGGLTNHHQGNKRFRDIVALHRPDYVRAPKIQKPSVARVIVRAIRNGDPPGRFLKKDDKTGKWIDIGDKKAAEKTSQALREKTSESTDPPSPSTPFTSPTMVVPTPTANGTKEPATSKKGEDKDVKMEAAEEKKDKEGTDTSKETKEVVKEESKDADAMDVDKATDDGNDEKKVDKEVEIAEV
mmetsp:Transcript_46190/g.70647  ORF Transcript_46190/g.70647 Transcript_46190/m.70647 type:complete len:875 (-) Transcript_46190:72-2696(-)